MNFPFLIHSWKPIFEILILWFVIFRIMLFFEGTRAFQVMRGIIILLLAFLLIQKLDFVVLDWLFTKLFAFSVLAILLVFQPEIRHGLARLGQGSLLFDASLKKEEADTVLKEILNATENLCQNKIGALIALTKSDPLTEYINTGVIIDAKVSSDLIESLFSLSSVLHDGGLVIQRGRIVAAGCLFPLSDKQDLSRLFGTRHRAALGLSEGTDAIIIVVSEERQDMSLVYQNQLFKNLSKEDIFTKIKEILKLQKEDGQKS